MSYHEITIIGNLGRDPELRYTPGGLAVANFPLAANRRYRDNQGEQVKETVWFKVTLWERQAEIANQFLQRGSQVMIRGRLNPDPDTGSPRVFDRRDGSCGASYEVTAREIVFLGGHGSEEPADEVAQNPNQIDNQIPF